MFKSYLNVIIVQVLFYVLYCA